MIFTPLTKKALLISFNAHKNQVDKGGMPAHRLGRQWRFKISEIDEWLRSGAAADAEEATNKGDTKK